MIDSIVKLCQYAQSGLCLQTSMKYHRCNQIRSKSLHAALLSMTLTFAGCGSFLPASGPDTGEISSVSDSQRLKDIQIVDLNDTVVNTLLLSQKQNSFSETFNASIRSGNVIGAGDVIEVSIWELSPALFSGVVFDPRSSSAASHVTTLPEQMVNSEGTINIPFVGQIEVAGRSIQQIETEIKRCLKGKANQPQVLVRTVRNNTTNVTVVGEVASSIRMPLTARKERVLDALAAAGGVRMPVNKMTLQLTRGSQVQAMPLDMIIRDPKQNILLLPDDVVTLSYQPLSFTALGATGKNEEINFEAQGISLSQALARSGGLQDNRANAEGVFIFRYESAKALGLHWKGLLIRPDGKIPVIYRVNLKDPATLFIAQNFIMQNKDLLYVSNAQAADYQKFLNMVVSIVYPVVNVINAIPSLP